MHSYSMNLGGRTLTIEAGKIAKQANGAVLVRYGDTAVSLFPCGSDCKESACNSGDLGSVRGSGRSPGEGNGNPLQCSCLENPRDGGAWRAADYGVAQSRTRLK